ncbi:phosphoglucomutase 1 [Coprinopsis cinerea okayama7|uniref:Phosphoglucomutase 1 n=1 Tax=Coprinopsis cinerea (strain Okayama-7 / 130 / ATCC MYA-4618 / FGSC 9003) TaxID=240176 RepID=A8NG63_COPC7|nr:phosphoglucomutase 1 [Coprinopsis cinerea okayama7\|eukprot:XP_001833488.2 phosphoglucomutase 1 [Coprinopsis cinerea okayama7\
MDDLEKKVQEWLRLDKNPETRTEVERLWSEKNIDELNRRMSTRIEFGTAGLRGRMEAGWARMNDLTVIQASQGLAEYVAGNVNDAPSRGVVVGYDHRYHSKRWASLTAAIFVQRGFKAYLYDGFVHTPLVPFGVKYLNAACGVMITASHNPKQDNGYKVYWENAVQIISPHDEGIAKSIDQNLEPRADSWSTDVLASSANCIDKTKEVQDVYFASLRSLEHFASLSNPAGVTPINTSMHGVSDPFVRRAFETLGYEPFKPVKEQQVPDPEFPTVKFPNPEEKGALDLAIATADRESSSYILAQDPDSDRFSAAEKQASGKWHIFTGDQLGTLFASYLIEKRKRAGRTLGKIAMVASTVSSKMLESMAEIEGFKFVECLTGFKYIGNTALDLVREGYEVPFGYEEAIGFMFGSEIRDKDGVAATVIFVDLIAFVRAQGLTVFEYLDTLYAKYGHFKSNNGYFVCQEPAKIDAIFNRIRNFTDSEKDRSFPPSIAGVPIVSVVDLTLGYDSRNPPTFKPSLPLSSGHMLQFRAGRPEDSVKIILTTRTSGTEPKIKFYMEGSGKDLAEVERVLKSAVDELSEVWMEAEKNGLPVVRPW